MPKKSTNKYWGKEEEDNIVLYQQTRDEKLYSEQIIPHFRELIKNIYLTYNFHKILSDYNTIEQEMLAFIFEKIDNYDQERGTKAFSYFGTVIKNWMIQKSNKEKKKIHIDDENQAAILNAMSIKIYDHEIHNDFSNALVEEVSENLLNYTDVVELDEDDVKIISIINEIISNYHKVDIYNKKQLYVYIRESCDFPTRKITKAINKIKIMYFHLKEDFNN